MTPRDATILWITLGLCGVGLISLFLAIAFSSLGARNEPENADSKTDEVPDRERLLGAASAIESDDDAGAPAEPSRGQRQAARSSPSDAGAVFEALSLRDAVEIFRQAHHIAVLGASGDGKTMTGHALMSLLQGQALVIDPYHSAGKWGGLPVATVDQDGDWREIEMALDMLDREMERRRVQSSKGLAIGDPLYILWDEVNLCVESLGKEAVGSRLRKWARGMRQFDMHLILYVQSDQVEPLGLAGHGDARKNLMWLYIGDDARRLAKTLKRQKEIQVYAADGLLGLTYPGIAKWREEFYAIDMSDAQAIIKGSRPMQPWPGGANPKQQPSEAIPGVDDLDVFVALARLVKSGVVTGETRMLEVAFDCGSGGSVKWQRVLTRFKQAKGG